MDVQGGGSTAATPTTPAKETKKRQRRRHVHPCPYPQCPRTFTCPHNVEQHIAEKHRVDREHACHLCVAFFARPWSLNRHLKKVHGVDRHLNAGRAKKKRVGMASGGKGGSLGETERVDEMDVEEGAVNGRVGDGVTPGGLMLGLQGSAQDDVLARLGFNQSKVPSDAPSLAHFTWLGGDLAPNDERAYVETSAPTCAPALDNAAGPNEQALVEDGHEYLTGAVADDDYGDLGIIRLEDAEKILAML